MIEIIYLLLLLLPIYASYRIAIVTAPPPKSFYEDDERLTNDIDGFMKIYFALTTEKEKDPTKGDKNA